MRLWHYKLLPFLDSTRLIRQHCECCALRGNGWNRKHATVQYVFNHDHNDLVQYHYQVIREMQRRGYKTPDAQWFDCSYRGHNCEPWRLSREFEENRNFHYAEHNDHYLKACLLRLLEKGDVAAKSTVHNFLLSPYNDFFDAEVHNKAFIAYCETVIYEDGHIEYACPSHEQKLIAMYAQKHYISIDEAMQIVRTKPMHLDFLLDDLKCVMVWYDSKMHNAPLNKAQHEAISTLLLHHCVSDGIL